MLLTDPRPRQGASEFAHFNCQTEALGRLHLPKDLGLERRSLGRGVSRNHSRDGNTRPPAVSRKQPVVFLVVTDPEPNDSFLGVQADGAERQAHANGPLTANAFEVQRRMLRIRLQQLKVLTRELLNVGGKLVEGTPEAP